MVKLSLELNEEENLFLYSLKLSGGLSSKAKVVKALIGKEMSKFKIEEVEVGKNE